MPKISVIVPVYNVEKYIKECIESLLNQSFSDFELILVDDGSTDLSGNICDSYKEQDARIKVFHKLNGGVSSARNLGIEESSGDWIVFVDSDDFVDKNYLKDMYDQSAECDVVSCGFMIVDEKGIIKKKILEPVGLFRSDCLDKYVNCAWWSPAPWGHLIASKIIKENSILFPTNRSMGEDAVFILSCLSYAKCVRNISSRLYYYRMTPGSLVHPSEKKIEKFIDDYRWTNNRLKEIGQGRFFFYYKRRSLALLTFVAKEKKTLVKEIFQESQRSGKGEFFYWLRVPFKMKFLMLYIFVPKKYQLFVLKILFRLCLKAGKQDV